MKVLVVGDSARLQTSIGAGLRDLGYDLDVVADGAEAIAHAANRDYDIVILDLMLPRESSLPLLHELRELDRDPVILILSARDQIHDRVTALIQGADDYLLKPVSVDELHNRIQSLLLFKSDAVEVDGRAASAATGSRSKHQIRNLLGKCRGQAAKIELLISEVKPAELLDRVRLDLEPSIARKSIRLQLPGRKQPSLLIDSRWTQLLLTELLEHVVRKSPAGATLRVGLDTSAEFAVLEIESRLIEAIDTARLKTLFESHADCMNFGFDIEADGRKRLLVRLSNIKIV